MLTHVIQRPASVMPAAMLAVVSFSVPCHEIGALFQVAEFMRS
jgi:hypothetical protein